MTTNSTEEVQSGKTYKVAHSRKGKFSMTVTRLNDDWVTGEIVDGKAGTIFDHNECVKGEEITVRRSFCTFSEVLA